MGKLRLRINENLWLMLYGLLLLLPHLTGSSKLDDGNANEVMQRAKAAEIASFMNENVDPCQNFYKFACGNWARINPATTLNKMSTGLFERLTEGLNRKVKRILNSEGDDLDTEEDVQVRNFYRSCVAMRHVDSNYRQKLKDLIAEFGKMPALTPDWQETEFDWLDTVGRIAYRYAIPIILSVEVSKDFVNNENNVAYIGQQEFPLETRSMYLDNSTAIYRHSYQNNMAKKLQNFLGLPRLKSVQLASELMDFEVELARGLINMSEGLQLTDIAQLSTIAEMQQSYGPVLDVERLVNISLGEQIKGNVYDFNPQYQQNLKNVIGSTPQRVIANYIFFRLINEFIIEPGKTLAKRQEKCITLTKQSFSKNLDNMIFRRYNNNDTASDIDLIWHQLKSTFEQTLQSDESLNWISRQTRESAIEKLAAMKLVVNSYANENLTEDFAGLRLQREDYVENLRQTFMLASIQHREQLHQPVKPLDAGDLLSYTPANILVENTIKVPVSLLQPYYLWAASYPNAIKFGTLGALIGHELIHGFDDTGRKFDARGNINDWWDEQSTHNFETRQRCFSEQYRMYVYHGIQLPKAKSQSENIADNGGLRLAYAAYRNLQSALDATVEGRRQLLKEKLPTLNYTNMQLFFISYAQIWCNDAHTGIHNLQISVDQHVPGELRVIGTLSNFDEFAKEFQCAVGTRMNPSNKCKIY
ncbi:neprilysin-4 [Drosophila mojavensis]|uniref:Uncharacterized protein n=1 Tax=Drosophila mojavensis TaxID=7230 RepID=B4K5F2_DROMO|nr:neprilysin-4 [Drosophila mojavensis]EDW16178.1 uncharacterized protein Dmoj_GI22369 [Drosophila mojavensis]